MGVANMPAATVLNLPTTRTSYLIGRADRLVRAELEQRLSGGPMTLNEVSVLSVLTNRPGLSNAELARRSLVTPQAMHKVVRSLEESGLISRGPTPSGGRSLAATITTKGEVAMAEAEVPMGEAAEVFLEPLDEQERADLRRLLFKLARVEPEPTSD